jgi:hypothetical protein
MKINQAVRDRLAEAYRRGRENGGLSCCGTSAVMHLPLCPALPVDSDRVQRLEDWWVVWGGAQ